MPGINGDECKHAHQQGHTDSSEELLRADGLVVASIGGNRRRAWVYLRRPRISIHFALHLGLHLLGWHVAL